MKATGIVRRIDDLGRVVIPKEIRRTMRIREGDPLEIYTDRDGSVIFKKYSLLGGVTEFAAQMCDTLNRTTGRTVVITDRDSTVAVAGAPRRELADQAISPELERLWRAADLSAQGWGGPHPSVRRSRALLPGHGGPHPVGGGRVGLCCLCRTGGCAGGRRGGVQAGPVRRRLSGAAHGELTPVSP